MTQLATITPQVLEIVADEEPFAKLRALLDMDIDGLKCVSTEAYRVDAADAFFTIDAARLADYATQVLEPMAERLTHYVTALRMVVAAGAAGMTETAGK